MNRNIPPSSFLIHPCFSAPPASTLTLGADLGCRTGEVVIDIEIKSGFSATDIGTRSGPMETKSFGSSRSAIY